MEIKLDCVAQGDPCWNVAAIEAFADNPTQPHLAAGQIACLGCTENPAMGTVCSAEIAPDPTAERQYLIMTRLVQGFRLRKPIERPAVLIAEQSGAQQDQDRGLKHWPLVRLFGRRY